VEKEPPPSALPSTSARVLAFVAILVAGVLGGLIGFAVVRVECRGACGTPKGIGAFSGAVIAAGGVAVVAVLVLRAMGEWRVIQARQAREAREADDGDQGPNDNRRNPSA
jgi:hypothetical protein